MIKKHRYYIKQLLWRFGILFFFLMQHAECCAALESVIEFNKIRVSHRTGQGYVIVGLHPGERMGSSQKWVAVDCFYATTVEWIDELLIKCYILAASAEARREPLVLIGQTTYVNISRGLNHTATFYIHPNTSIRYGEIIKVRCEAWVNGMLNDELLWPQRREKSLWWEQYMPIRGLLQSHLFTPFAYKTQFIEEQIKIPSS